MRRACVLLLPIISIFSCACLFAQTPSIAQTAQTAQTAASPGGASWKHLRLDDGFLKHSAASKRSTRTPTKSSKEIAKETKEVKDSKDTKDGKSAVVTDPLVQAQDFVKANKVDDAINILNGAIKSNPSDYHLLELRAHCYVEIGQNYQALTDLTQAIALKPSDVVLRRERANVHFLLHDYAHCLEDLDAVSKNGAFTAADYFLKANCYSSLGEPKLVVENATAGLKLAPNNVEGYFTRAKAYLKLNQRQLGDADFDKAVALEKKH